MIGGTPQLDAHRLAARSVQQLDGPAVLVQPPVAPLHQCDQRGKQIRALFGQPVALARALTGFAVVLALEQPLLDQLTQPVGRNWFADPDALGEVIKARGPVEGLAQDQKCRPSADDVECLGDRAALSPRPRVPAGSRGVRGGVGGLRSRDQPSDARRLPRRPSGRGGTAHAHVAGPDPGDVLSRASVRSRPHVDRGRRPRRGRRAGRRRLAGGRELALGIPGQRAGRSARAGRGLAPTASRPRSSGPGPGRLRCRVRHARGRRARARAGPGWELGVGRRQDDRRTDRRGGLARTVRGQLRASAGTHSSLGSCFA